MASGDKTGLFNAALASLLAAATGFAMSAMPEGLMRASLGDLGLDAAFGAPTRGIITAVASALSFLAAYTALRACDGRDREHTNPSVREWPACAGIAAQCVEPEVLLSDLDDPFAELARGAQRVDDLLELTSEQIAANEDEAIDIAEPISRPPIGASVLIQRLNAGLAETEWPLSPDADEAEDRLRGVLRQLRATSRGP